MSSLPERVMVLWIPDWPIIAHHRAHGGDPGLPLALLSDHRVVACSGAARASGVRVGQREREARGRCPALEVHPHTPPIDAQQFAPILTALERLVPGVEPLRPGLCALRARGPARYFGGEAQAADQVLGAIAETGLVGARVGIANGRFAAEQAARAAAHAPGVDAPGDAIRIIAPEHLHDFLSPLPVTTAAEASLSRLLLSLGVRTLGALAALPEDSVQQRFGAPGLSAYRRARGLGALHAAEVRPRPAERDLAREIGFEPPITQSDHLAFACSATAESLIRDLWGYGLMCTEVRVELIDDLGVRHERVWAHPERFTDTDVLTRVRWQAETLPGDADRGGAGIAGVRLTPVRTARASQHEPGLWNSAPDERVHHHLSRLQNLLGPEGVATLEVHGGRVPAERQSLVPWGTPRGGGQAHSPDGPWPGRLIGMPPTLLLHQPRSAELSDAHDRPISPTVDDDLTGVPATLRIAGESARRITAWSRLWTLHQRWWRGHSPASHLQVIDDRGVAWLLRFAHTSDPPADDASVPHPHGWLAEAQYV